MTGSVIELFRCKIQQGLEPPFCQQVEWLDQLTPSHTTLKRTFLRGIRSHVFYSEFLSLSQLYKVSTIADEMPQIPSSRSAVDAHLHCM